MRAKDEKRWHLRLTLKNIIYTCIFLLILCYVVIFYNLYFVGNTSYAKETNAGVEEQGENGEVKFSNANVVSIDEIIEKNAKPGQTEEVVQEDAVLEYLTDYRINPEVPKGVSYVVQEGRQGIQKITKKRIYQDGNMVSEEQISAVVTKSSLNKIVEIGEANYTVSHTVKVGEKVYVTSDRLAVMSEPSEDTSISVKIATLKTDDELTVLQIGKEWYKISCGSTEGWVKQECTVYQISKKEENQNSSVAGASKQTLLSKLSFDMKLNKPSGLTLDQFKKVLTDSKDVNNIFSSQAEYFYYIEKQYNINGIFVAAVGIHESAWGTSKIAREKYNLFGYGAYDSNPYNGAYKFTSYSESIDLVSRVFVKYYLNPKGTSIYGGETAVGTYYTEPTLQGVNRKYATDKNWANAVYSHIKYLYNKI